jgi:hypothetical protein
MNDNVPQLLGLMNNLKAVSRDSFYQRELAQAVTSLKDGEYENSIAYLDSALLMIERVPFSSRETVRFVRNSLNKQLAKNKEAAYNDFQRHRLDSGAGIPNSFDWLASATATVNSKED